MGLGWLKLAPGRQAGRQASPDCQLSAQPYTKTKTYFLTMDKHANLQSPGLPLGTCAGGALWRTLAALCIHSCNEILEGWLSEVGLGCRMPRACRALHSLLLHSTTPLTHVPPATARSRAAGGWPGESSAQQSLASTNLNCYTASRVQVKPQATGGGWRHPATRAGF